MVERRQNRKVSPIEYLIPVIVFVIDVFTEDEIDQQFFGHLRKAIGKPISVPEYSKRR